MEFGEMVTDYDLRIWEIEASRFIWDMAGLDLFTVLPKDSFILLEREKGTQVENSDRVPASWFPPGPVLADGLFRE